MLFNSAAFAVFISLFLAIYHLFLKTRSARLGCILIGSLVFYGGWDFRYIPLLLGTATLDFLIARQIEFSRRRERRLLLVWLSVAANLGVLTYFKYTNFFLSSAYGLLQALKFPVGMPPHFEIILPVGISFYTFQSMSYVIDVYRGELRARRMPLEFLAGVTFFPHLVAGPIIRSGTLLPQFDAMEKTLASAEVQRALLLFFTGLVKKGVGNMLGVHADFFYQNLPRGSLAAWVGTLAFTGQIYADFSGYSDMAVGLALLLGFRLPANFNYPYLSTSPADFWRRWHISLSSWIRDYLFLPLAERFGSKTSGLVCVVLVTMALVGLWHGANWTFVLFGLYHGVLLVLSHSIPLSPPSLVKTALTFYAVHIGWILFRAPNVLVVRQIVSSLHLGLISQSGPHAFLWGRLAFVVSAIVFCHLINAVDRLNEPSGRYDSLRWATIGVLSAVGLAANGSNEPFIYFQF